MNDVSTPRVLLWIPLPPPLAGPEVASRLLAEACRRHLPSVIVENATLRADNMTKGRVDIPGLSAFLKAYPRFLRAAHKSDVVYLVAAAGTMGCLRDAVLIASARVMGRRIVLHFRGGRYQQYFAESSWTMKRVLRFAWGSASQAIVQVPGLRGALAEAAPHVDVAVLPNGLPSKEHPAKRDYTTDDPRILFVGHLTYAKGFYDLMHAFAEVRKKWPRAVLVCAGELPRAEASLAAFLPAADQKAFLAQMHRVSDEIRAFLVAGDATGVHYAGIVSGPAKKDLFAGADLFVLPSYTEGFSLAILEAMFHGLPVVTTRIGGSPDIVRDGVNGLLIEPGDRAGLVVALERMVASQAMRESMGRLNAREAREHYELEVVAKQFAAILQQPASP